MRACQLIADHLVIEFGDIIDPRYQKSPRIDQSGCGPMMFTVAKGACTLHLGT